MMSFTLRILGLSGALAVAQILCPSPVIAQETTTQEAAGRAVVKDQQRGAILAPVQGYVDAWNAHDGQALGATFTDDGDFVGISGTWWTGAEEIGAVHDDLFSGRYSDSVFALDGAPEVTLLAPDVALAHWRWTISQVRDADGAEVPPYSGLFTTILTRDGDEWGIRAGQNNVID